MGRLLIVSVVASRDMNTGTEGVELITKSNITLSRGCIVSAGWWDTLLLSG